MPNIAASVQAFNARFKPERTRAVFLNPNMHGTFEDQSWLAGETDQLWNLRAQVTSIDARRKKMQMA